MPTVARRQPQLRPTPRPKGPATKALLWLVLAITLAADVSTSFAFDGVRQVLISVCTGAVMLGSGVALFLLREKHA
ncbi:hypothetical protein [Streptomyces sp. NPDC002855]|uniref:hypothetical protein n=1 Tax=unclassified Streptomyces TaxID=2593676 RepID=UPI00332E854C